MPISVVYWQHNGGNMKRYVVKYYWPRNHHEVYAFFCMADNIEHAIEQCENAYPNNCHILSVEET